MFLAKTIRKNTEAVVSFILRRICFEAWIHFNWSFLSLTLLKTASVVLSFGQESKFCSKIEIFFKTRNFVQKSKFWSKIEILVKNRNFGEKSKFCSKVKIVVTNRNFGQESKFWSRIEILFKNRNFSGIFYLIHHTFLRSHWNRIFSSSKLEIIISCVFSIFSTSNVYI